MSRFPGVGVDSAALWSWLMRHPDLDWLEVGEALGCVPVAAIKAMMASAPTREDALRQHLLRNLRRYFREGWDPEAKWPRAKLAGMVFGDFPEMTNEQEDRLLRRLDSQPAGWRPEGHDDVRLAAITHGILTEQS